MVVPKPDLDHAIEQWIASLLQAGPRAVRLQKKLIREWEDLPLREAVRALAFTNVDVFAGRAAEFQASPSSNQQGTLASPKKFGHVVILRAVEHFDSILPAAADLVGPAGRLAILIGKAQLDRARHLIPSVQWGQPTKLPQSSSRFLLLGRNESR